MAQFIRAFDGGSPTLIPISRITQIYVKAIGRKLFAIVVVSLDENNEAMENIISTHTEEQGARRYIGELLCVLNDGCDPKFCIGNDDHNMPHNP